MTKKMVEEKIYTVQGEIQEKGKKKPFTKNVKAKSQTFATEKAMCLFGSKNKIKRNKITIKETKEAEQDGGTK